MARLDLLLFRFCWFVSPKCVGFDGESIPCFDIRSASARRSARDRRDPTPVPADAPCIFNDQCAVPDHLQIRLKPRIPGSLWRRSAVAARTTIVRMHAA